MFYKGVITYLLGVIFKVKPVADTLGESCGVRFIQGVRLTQVSIDHAI